MTTDIKVTRTICDNQRKSDFITIGHLINELTHQQDEDLDYGVGLYYCNYLKSNGLDSYPDAVVKKLLVKVGFSSVEVFNFIKDDQMFRGIPCITDPLPVSHAHAHCTLQLYSNVDLSYMKSQNKCYADYIIQMVKKYGTFIVLDNLVSLKPGSGRELVQRIRSTLTYPIALQAGFLKYGDYVTFQNTGNKCVIEKLVRYYESLGFKNVNSDMGYYGEAVTMLYVPK